MQFYVFGYKRRPPKDTSFPCVVLIANGWDDFGHKTLFGFQFWSDADHVEFEHDVKILSNTTKRTADKIPEQFEQLADGFCCLGQSIEYYQILSQLSSSVTENILEALNDIVAYPAIDQNFKNVSGYDTSLLRFSEAEKAYSEGSEYLGASPIVEPKAFQFTFSTTVPGAESPHKLEFDFSPTPLQRERIIALIGRNGTGKTQILARLANTISGYLTKQGELNPYRPKFSKIVAVSYSAFDLFERPPRGASSYSYVYCGIMSEDAVKSRAQISGELITAVGDIAQKSRQDIWRKVTARIFDESLELSNDDLRDEQLLANLFARMSSGQRVLMLVLSQMVSQLQTESLVLYDEPELHLHPNWISALTLSLYDLLEEFKSYAIIATHSPILLQEIPSRNVRIIRRYGSEPRVSPLSIESFGENLTEITSDVFERDEGHENYQRIIEEWSGNLSMEQVVQEFDGRLGFNAMASLTAAYLSKNGASH